MAVNGRHTVRRTQRQQKRIAVVLLVDPEGEQVEHQADTVDLSEFGLRAKGDVALLAPGQIVGVIAGKDRDFPLVGRVVWVGQAGSDRDGEAGFEFLNPPSSPFASGATN